ncbi:Mu-like prophage major head subunit gpT family protein [Vallitalea guaymasensis]|uniref:Mu-like prophage major head subunit gpT family protein n=1 Tax=Vallitalea guaymasensis TaxID=1185412 RepID=UPI000DE2B7AC|nr:Mu-like prophage major head subunit gpT family protein [Vallitalea guaymasensis]
MQINQAVLKNIYIGFKTIFNKALQNTEPLYKKIATIVPSSTKTEEYKWLGKIPRMREWIGSRVIQNLGAHDYAIKNKSYELTISVDRDDIDDDTLGIYNPLMKEMGVSVASHPDDLVFGILKDGFTGKCYDKKTFFSDKHTVGKKTCSNMSTYKLTNETYGDARATMMSLLDEKEKPLKIKPNLLVVPPQLEAVGRRILLAEKEANGSDNIYYKSAELLVVPDLADKPTAWYLLDVSRPIRPLIFQQRKKPQFVSKTKETDENVFNDKEYIYGADSRDNAGYGLWQLAYGSTGATNKPQA